MDQLETILERAAKRLEKIKKDNDEGIYAKNYVEDVEALLELLIDQEVPPPMWGKEEVDVELSELQQDINSTKVTVYVVAIDGADKLHATTNLSAAWVERLKEMGAVRVFAVEVPLPGLVHVDHVFHVRSRDVQVLPVVEKLVPVLDDLRKVYTPEIMEPDSRAEEKVATIHENLGGPTIPAPPTNPGTSRLDEEEARIMEETMREALREGPNS